MAGMIRPSAELVDRALVELGALVARAGSDCDCAALDVLRDAVAPRPVWPAKETAAAFGVFPSNLDDVRGLPAPAQELPRPSVTHPDKVMRLWYADEIEAFAPEYRARRRAERGEWW